MAALVDEEVELEDDVSQDAPSSAALAAQVPAAQVSPPLVPPPAVPLPPPVAVAAPIAPAAPRTRLASVPSPDETIQSAIAIEPSPPSPSPSPSPDATIEAVPPVFGAPPPAIPPVFASLPAMDVAPVVVAEVDPYAFSSPVVDSAPTLEVPAVFGGSSPAADDSRSSRRFPFEISVDIVSDHNFYAGLSLNISEGGLFIATHVEYPVGTSLEIRLLLPGDEEPTAIMTEVRWTRPHNENADGSAGMGLRFVDLTPEVLAKVALFAQNRDPLYYEDD